MSELRQNPVNEHWVIIAKERAKRPQDFIRTTERVQNSIHECPFEQGKESLTPPEALAYSPDPARKPNTPNWTMRVFANKFPAVAPAAEFVLEREDMYKFGPATGFHEIIAPADHYKHPALLSNEELFLLFKAQKERIMFYKQTPFIRYTQLFYNHGESAGASLAHPHAQFLALPVVSNYVTQELYFEQQYQKKHGTCGHCAMIAAEIKLKKRVIMQNKSFLSTAPFASRNPFEIVIYPLWHTPRYEDANDEQLRDLAQVLKDALLRLHEKLKNPDFNYYTHTVPHHNGNYDYSHWHLKILPRLSTRGGFELATGIVINVVSPEDAAAFLRGERDVEEIQK